MNFRFLTDLNIRYIIDIESVKTRTFKNKIIKNL